MHNQKGMHDLSLYSDPFAVDNSNCCKTAQYCLMQIFVHRYPDFAWLKGVQVKGVLDWDFVHRGRI